MSDNQSINPLYTYKKSGTLKLSALLDVTSVIFQFTFSIRLCYIHKKYISTQYV